MDSLINELSEFGNVELDKTFSQMTTFRVGGKIKYTLYPRNEFSLKSTIAVLNNHEIPYKVIGNGSNLLCSDDEFDGAVIRLSRTLNDSYFDGETLYAMAGCSLIALAIAACGHSLSGLEFASGIPGSVGGAIFMNAGAYKASISDLIEEVTVLKDNHIVVLKNSECDFAYRSSAFQLHPDWIILSCKLKLKTGNQSDIKTLMENRQKRRMDSQPLEFPSAGSTFRNPENGFCWELIDRIGYRGRWVGGAQVSEKHSNFIINANHASASDIHRLINEIVVRVQQQCGVELKTEVEQFNWK